METLLGIVMLALSLLAWGGQAIVWFAPALGVKLGLSEAEADVEPVVRLEANAVRSALKGR